MDRTCITHLRDETYMQDIVGCPEEKEDFEKLSVKIMLPYIKD